MLSRRSAASGDNGQEAPGHLGVQLGGNMPALCLFSNSAAAGEDVVLYFGIIDILQVGAFDRLQSPSPE